MADAPATSHKANLDWATQKVGPLPLWAWLAAGIGIWWWMQRQQSSSSTASASAVPNQQTDPAGNVGTIDPATGYVYGTPEDLAALAANNAGTSSTGTTAGTSGTSGAQTYADNNTWGIAAVNYLVGLGIDATTANQAVQNYLSSQPLTTAEQGDVNLAIQALGPPPSLPGPMSTNPNPVTTPGSGTTTTTTTSTGKTSTGTTSTKKVTAAVPTGLVVSEKHSTSLQVKWNKSANATSYHVLCTDMASKKITNQFDVPSSQLYANCGGLTPSHSYVIDVWAEPEAGAVGTGPHAEVSTTLPKTG
jgi:Fibronectin type III domain